jgi:hypothetical protein
MGIREDIANVIGSIAATMPEAAHTLRHGTASGKVVQSSARDFAETVSEVGPAEVARYIATAADFPELDKGAAVELDGSLRVVVSLKTDPIGATYTVGMSDTFESNSATYRGKRREDGAVRSFQHPLSVLVLESGTADTFADALAPSYAVVYLVALRAEDWPEVTAPEVSDTIEVAPDCHPVTLKVSTVSRHGGWYVLKCRTKG